MICRKKPFITLSVSCLVIFLGSHGLAFGDDVNPPADLGNSYGEQSSQTQAGNGSSQTLKAGSDKPSNTPGVGVQPKVIGVTPAEGKIIEIPGHYLGPEFAAPSLPGEEIHPQSYNLNFVTPPPLPSAPSDLSHALIVPAAPVSPVISKQLTPAGALLQNANTPPGGAGSEPAQSLPSVNFEPPNEPSELIAQAVPSNTHSSDTKTSLLRAPVLKTAEKRPVPPLKKLAVKAGSVAALNIPTTMIVPKTVSRIKLPTSLKLPPLIPTSFLRPKGPIPSATSGK